MISVQTGWYILQIIPMFLSFRVKMKAWIKLKKYLRELLRKVEKRMWRHQILYWILRWACSSSVNVIFPLVTDGICAQLMNKKLYFGGLITEIHKSKEGSCTLRRPSFSQGDGPVLTLPISFPSQLQCWLAHVLQYFSWLYSMKA